MTQDRRTLHEREAARTVDDVPVRHGTRGNLDADMSVGERALVGVGHRPGLVELEVGDWARLVEDDRTHGGGGAESRGESGGGGDSGESAALKHSGRS